MVLLAVTIFFENSGDLESSCQPVIYLKTFIKISRNIPPTLHPATVPPLCLTAGTVFTVVVLAQLMLNMLEQI